MRMISKVVVVTVMGLALGACADKRKTGLTYMPDMADSPTVKAQESFLNPPDHSVDRNAVFYPASAEESENVLKNPLAKSADSVAEGKKYYDKVCIVCHGPNGLGNGSLTEAYPKAPNLTLDHVVSREDGWFFHRISFGVGVMPGYKHSLTVKERWQIIHYLRTLQEKAR